MNDELTCYLQELLSNAVQDAEDAMNQAIEQDLPEADAIGCFRKFARATKMQLIFEDEMDCPPREMEEG